jgi:CHAD domain-containing protein/transposase-like protein
MLTSEVREKLLALSKSNMSLSVQRRARLLLAYDQGSTTAEIALEVGLSEGRVRSWRRAFEVRGMAIFPDEELEFEKAQSEPGIPDESTEPAVLEVSPSEISARAKHVRNLAVQLFRSTQAEHGLPEEHGALLAAAAQLFDVSIETEGSDGSGKGAPLDLAGGLSEFSPAEQQAIAVLLRYQRGKIKPSEENPLEVEPLMQHEAILLIGFLRLALALDASASQSTTLEQIKTLSGVHYVIVAGPHAGIDTSAAQAPVQVLKKHAGLELRVITSREAKMGVLAPNELPLPEPMKQPGIEPADLVAEAGRKILRFQFAQMLAHEDGTRQGDDIEELHDMRVAVRRMRVAFEIFDTSFAPKILKSHLKELRVVGKSLGRVRDLDVFEEKARRYLRDFPEDQQSRLDPLLDGWAKQRETYRKKMLSYLDGERYQHFLRNFNRFVQVPGEGVRKSVQESFSPGSVRHLAPAMIYHRLGAVRIYQDILDTATIEQLHALRIEFKKLRYIMEFFREVLDPRVKNVITEIKKVQDHLGDLNDADVAVRILGQFLDQWEIRQQSLPLNERENPEPIFVYLTAKHAERHHLMTHFQETWDQFERGEVMRDLALGMSVL